MTLPRHVIPILAAVAALAAPARAAVETTAAPVNKAALNQYADEAEQELRGNILPFWLKYARDTKHGGFHAFVGEDLSVNDDIPRGSLLTSRILWTFSAAYRIYRDPQYLEMAQWAYKDLAERFEDKQYGGLFWAVGKDGTPADPHKQIYGQVFGIYGLSEYYRATGDVAALEKAIAIYRLVEEHAHDPVNGGYFDSLSRQWAHENGPKTNLLGEAPKSQNSHIHILEGFTNLLRVWPDEGLRERQRQLIELTFSKIIDTKTNHLVLFMKDDWTPIGEAVSYGHDIELSWLLVEATEVLGDPELVARARLQAVEIAKVTNSQGIDADGGVYNEGDPKGPTNTHKEWWEQAESTVGFLNAYEITGDPAYFQYSRRSWTFIQAKFVDRVHGDWHNTLNKDGTPILAFTTRSGRKFPSAKLSIWKCPYHNSRACMELIERARDLAGEYARGP